MNLKKIGKLLTRKSVGTGPSSYEKRIYRAAVSQRLRNTALHFLPTSLSVLNQVFLNEDRLMMMYLSSLQTVMC